MLLEAGCNVPRVINGMLVDNPKEVFFGENVTINCSEKFAIYLLGPTVHATCLQTDLLS